MANHERMESPARADDSTGSVGELPAIAQLKREIAGLPAEEQRDRLQPSRPLQLLVDPVQFFSVYRGGSSTDSNLTPRPGKDTSGNKRGLSTFETLEEAASPGGKAQKIETDSLSELNAIKNGSGGNTHVSIRPSKDEDLLAWAAARGGSDTHKYTTEVRGAIAEQVKRPK